MELGNAFAVLRPWSSMMDRRSLNECAVLLLPDARCDRTATAIGVVVQATMGAPRAGVGWSATVRATDPDLLR